jgi:hypothetical protein
MDEAGGLGRTSPDGERRDRGDRNGPGTEHGGAFLLGRTCKIKGLRVRKSLVRRYVRGGLTCTAGGALRRTYTRKRSEQNPRQENVDFPPTMGKLSGSSSPPGVLVTNHRVHPRNANTLPVQHAPMSIDATASSPRPGTANVDCTVSSPASVSSNPATPCVVWSPLRASCRASHARGPAYQSSSQRFLDSSDPLGRLMRIDGFPAATSLHDSTSNRNSP